MDISSAAVGQPRLPEKRKIQGTQEVQKDKHKKSETQNKEGQPRQARQPGIKDNEFIAAIETANKSLKSYKTRFEFSIHEATKEIMVKVVNTETDEVIREIPPEKILDMVAKMWELAGIMVDEKV
ncbi:flagellar protein FlaG [Metallumcola ferriviriculae]|uniref:Flagellar protein FlaG n=1 Tax=Metallumcola ferriviriculae TaxID=3039180 RepID=A0AAU0UTP9_9FIRM|nr:flagellar protein FlaG [Desulfitibacteraceae bacterium MK1]